jgi:hypothetical protein
MNLAAAVAAARQRLDAGKLPACDKLERLASRLSLLLAQPATTTGDTRAGLGLLDELIALGAAVERLREQLRGELVAQRRRQSADAAYASRRPC